MKNGLRESATVAKSLYLHWCSIPTRVQPRETMVLFNNIAHHVLQFEAAGNRGL